MQTRTLRVGPRLAWAFCTYTRAKKAVLHTWCWHAAATAGLQLQGARDLAPGSLHALGLGTGTSNGLDTTAALEQRTLQQQQHQQKQLRWLQWCQAAAAAAASTAA